MKKTNNKGFSLVELIIVIAIMAILIGVLAPQYIKYVEKSRISSDKDMVDSLTKAVQTAITDEDYYDALMDGDDTVTITDKQVAVSKNLEDAMKEYYGMTSGTDTSKKFKSKAFKGKTVVITVVSEGGAAGGEGGTATTSSLQVKVEIDNAPYDPATIK